jgi:cobalt-zinc-cadmium efflux system membrane fusion protein
VIVILAALAWWGHTHEWNLPTYAELFGKPETHEEEWCNEHNVPEAQCIECNSTLLPPIHDFGWCAEHGVAQCPFEHPEVAQVAEVPDYLAEMKASAQAALALRDRKENDPHDEMYRRRIQFASAAAVEKVGIAVTAVSRSALQETVPASGEVIYDQTRLAHFSSRVPGTVWRVEKQLGETVKKGEVLALIDSAEVGRAKGELLQAISQVRAREATYNRVKPLEENGGVSAKTVREAAAALDEAKIRRTAAQQALLNLGLNVKLSELEPLSTDEVTRELRFLGIPQELASQLQAETTTTNLFPVRASLDGSVIESKAVVGEVVDTGATLLSVSDHSKMWLKLNIRQEDASFVAVGQTVIFQGSNGKENADIHGEIDWISTSADRETRTVQARAQLVNAAGRLKANTFGSARIVIRDEPHAMQIPTEAVHWDGGSFVVFVRDKHFEEPGAAEYFHVRMVRPGVQQGDRTEIIAGLLPDELVASKNSVLIYLQTQKGRLGEGEGDH